MAKNRKAAEKLCLDIISRMLPGSTNAQLYKEKFASMDDEEFELFIDQLDKKTTRLCIIAPNFANPHLEVAINLDLMEELGYSPFERVYVPATADTPRYLTPIPYLVLDLPVRRQAQMLDHKVSVAENNRSVDDLTGQPAGDSKSTTISYQEMQVLAGRGKEATLTEFLKLRGGDQKSFQAMNTMISRTGGVSQAAIEAYGGKVKSTETLATIFKALHIDSNL